MAVQTFAAITVGSFELELGIYELSARNGLRRVDEVRHVIGLGKDTYSTGKISYELVEELCRVLEDFVKIMNTYKVTDYRAYGTSAMREAKNKQIILDQIRVRTGLNIRVISNSEQRLISYKGIASKAAEFNRIIQEGAAILDMGYGSAQISLFDKDALVTTQNLPLGALRIRSLLERIPATAQLHRQQIEEIVDNELFTFRKMYLKDRQITNLIGIGDNILYLLRQIGQRVSGDCLEASVLMKFYDLFTGMTLDQIEERFGVTAEYASLLLPAVVVYKRVMEITGAKLFWLPGIRLCDGIAAEYGQEKKLLKLGHNFENDILAASRNMAKRYKCHASHNQILDTFSVDIFDAMRRFHGMSPRDKLLLRIAVYLHACGKFISIRNSNECAYNIIMSTEIIGLSHLEREIIANVVRYNIRDFDYNRVQLEAQVYKDASGGLTANEITIKIAKLTAILRLANSMDRTHKQKISGCKIAVRDGELVITTDYQGDISMEKRSFVQKADFFEEIFGIRPVLKQKRRV